MLVVLHDSALSLSLRLSLSLSLLLPLHPSSRSRPLHFGPPWQSRGPIIGKSASAPQSAPRARMCVRAVEPEIQMRSRRNVQIHDGRVVRTGSAALARVRRQSALRCAACLREFSNEQLIFPFPSPFRSKAIRAALQVDYRVRARATQRSRAAQPANATTSERRRKETSCRASRAHLLANESRE